jgi:hypothetical protein
MVSFGAYAQCFAWALGLFHGLPPVSSEVD